MNYQQTVDWLFEQLPQFQRIGAAAYKANLDNSLALDKAANHPHQKFKSIHVAGTNGKGSTSHLLASVLFESGYKTGLYTSPHLKDYRERIRINGELISEQFVQHYVAQNKELFEKMKPSFFEMTVALCFEYFASENVNVAVIETGMGGRLDSTNIIHPELSVITNIGFDHMKFLGETLPEIAGEKAGIIKDGVPVIIGETHNETKPVFLSKAKTLNSPIFFADEYYRIERVDSDSNLNQTYKINDLLSNQTRFFECPLQGIYQLKNLATVLKSIDELRNIGFDIADSAIQKGILNVLKNTGLRGRWEILSQKPLMICDTGHNEDGIRYIVQQLQSLKYNQLHMVIGFVNDKDVNTILKLLPVKARYYFCKSNNPRSLNEQDLLEKASEFELIGDSYPNVSDAIESAKSASSSDDVIFIGGSTFVVADIL